MEGLHGLQSETIIIMYMQQLIPSFLPICSLGHLKDLVGRCQCCTAC
jgi:hypothetical protein